MVFLSQFQFICMLIGVITTSTNVVSHHQRGPARASKSGLLPVHEKNLRFTYNDSYHTFDIILSNKTCSFASELVKQRQEYVTAYIAILL